MFSRMTITWKDEAERTALQRMAETDCRLPQDQVRYLIREEARRRGLLSINVQHPEGAHHHEPEPQRAA